MEGCLGKGSGDRGIGANLVDFAAPKGNGCCNGRKHKKS